MGYIRKDDIIKISVISKDNKLLGTIYDSGFTSVSDIFTACRSRFGTYGEIRILNESTGWYGIYNSQNKKV